MIPKCTGYLLHRAFWQEFLCVIWVPLYGTFCERTNYTHLNCLEINSPVTCICHRRELFPNYLCNHFWADPRKTNVFGGISRKIAGIHVLAPFMSSMFSVRQLKALGVSLTRNHESFGLGWPFARGRFASPSSWNQMIWSVTWLCKHFPAVYLNDHGDYPAVYLNVHGDRLPRNQEAASPRSRVFWYELELHCVLRIECSTDLRQARQIPPNSQRSTGGVSKWGLTKEAGPFGQFRLFSLLSKYFEEFISTIHWLHRIRLN